MARQSKKKKSILQEIRETIHLLTKPKRSTKKVTRRKAATPKQLKDNTESTQELQEKLEQKLTKKMSEDMQKMKLQVKQELLEKLTKPKPILKNNKNDSVKKKKKEVTVRKKVNGTGKIVTKQDKGTYKPLTDCTFLKLLILSDSVKGEVVVGYELLDNSSQEVWGIGIHEGTRLGRSKLILNTKVKSRQVESERQYYLANNKDDTLYFSENYKKPALLNGKVTIANYTNGLAEAIQQAYMAGYQSKSKIPKLRMVKTGN
ncbi:hypothetical protein [Paenibacillus radicis (ex Xue et al. 2023)]|uniref:Uncharacterized protein n=1 Tax=Paenibacillus radicis (ex Xue et al. 2023) TaxID=2972489 RepID=A0ABT1YAV4_9BACL|nr:hypothetical protein [Paenibacillus radicis (ex Xue et al. 2023)]MCR8630322.1 hypothetical protein [Paenibacillus radicis (ex Xue et al. 2023)]